MDELYNLKTIESGDRLEIYKYNSPITRGAKGKNDKGRNGSGKTSLDNKDINRKKVLYRARNNIIRLVNANKDLNIFITLTYKENFTNLEKSKSHLEYFFKKLRFNYPSLKYLWVLEYQERGAIHYHLLCNIPIDINTSKSFKKKTNEQKDLENLFKSKFWSNRGFVDIRNLKSEGNTNIGKYIAAYMVEDLFDKNLEGNRVYGYSKNINKPVVKIEYLRAKLDKLIIRPGYKLKFTNSYEIKFKDVYGNERTKNVTYLDYYKTEVNYEN